MKNQNKKKPQTQKPDSIHPPCGFPQPRQEGSPPELAGEALQFWDEAVEELVSVEFDSVDAAIQAIVDKVITRLGDHGADQSGVREFLLDLFHTDPELQAELREVLNIRA